MAQGPTKDSADTPMMARSRAATAVEPTTAADGPRPAGCLFSVGPSGKLVPHVVTTGLSSSRCTEVRGAALEAGLEVVTGVQRSEDSAGANPFQRKSAGEDHHRPAGF